MKEEGSKLSVIIPIFNVEEYLSKCIESVINQTYKNIEIILVNDGSTDNSSCICDDYKKKDSRIKVVHKENGGLSSARNAGLDIATGEYIAFLDSDDWVDSEMYNTLVEILEKYNADISACGSKDIYATRTVMNSNTGKIAFYNKESAINELVSGNSVRFEVWNKVFKKETIGDVRFKINQVFEDVYFDKIVLTGIEKLVYIDKPMHNYLRSRVGNTNSYFNERKLGIFKELDEFIHVLADCGLKDSSQRLEAYALHTAISLYLDASRLDASKYIKEQLILEHKKYHNSLDENKYINKKKSKLFKISPRLYLLLVNIRNGLLSTTKRNCSLM